MKTLSKIIAMSLSVITSSAAFAQASATIAGSSAVNPAAAALTSAREQGSASLSTLPSKEVTPISDLNSNRIDFKKFMDNHPVFDRFANNHPAFAEKVLKNHDQLQDKGITVKDAKDRFQKRAEKKQAEANKLHQKREAVFAKHPKFAQMEQHHPKVAERRLHAMRNR